MAKITKETVASVVLTLEEWATVKALIDVFGKQPLGSPGYEEFAAADAVVANVVEAKLKASVS